MIFKIAGTVIFNTLDSTVEFSGVQHIQKLSLPAAKLLEVLLEKNNEICEREYLLIEVWDKQGLTGSNGNLNHYISILRKVFSDGGIDNLILTVPRVGFRISSDICVEHVRPEPFFNDLKIAPFMPKRNYLYWLMAILFFLLALFLFFYLGRGKGISEVNLTDINYKGCQINYLSSFSDRQIMALNPIIVKKITENKIICDENDVVYFDHYESVNPGDLGRSLISVCQKGRGDTVVDCKSFYYTNLDMD